MSENLTEPDPLTIPVRREMDPLASEAVRIIIEALLAQIRKERAAKEAMLDERR